MCGLNDYNSPEKLSWRQSCYGFAAFCFGTLLVAWFLLRLVLAIFFHPEGMTAGDVVQVFLAGFHRDLLVGLLALIPLLFWFWFVPQRWFKARWHGRLFIGATFFILFGQFFLLFVEFFFFEEFKSRFNTVAVDYLYYPHEVVENIWESYHVGWFVGICLMLTFGWLVTAHKFFKRMWEMEVSPRGRFLCLAAVLLLAGMLLPTVRLKGARVSPNRLVNELANNGSISFVAAAWTHHLDYTNFYKTLTQAEAYARARQLLKEPQTEFVAEGESIRRRVAGDPSRPRLNVVILLEESFGSEFWGCLGRKRTKTPEMDKLAAEEGMLFTNLYANGNRTVRGMEGVLSSFPSLPGDSIVKRDLTDNVETIARVLKRDGYSTIFLYGGRGIFDGMRSYAVRNGYDQFIEQKHFARPTFKTAWGVCDEDLMARSVQELRELHKTGKPFLATILTVSNHRPYTYPKGRIPEDPDKRWRIHAVKYADYALGEFFRAVKKESFWTNTIFAVVADHGARVYGSQSIPIKSYEIPLLIAGPAVVKEAGRVGQLGCSLDVAPTILGLIGRPYETLFFGRDLLKMKPEEGRVLLGHNRDIGLLSQDRMVVLGLMNTEEFYQGNPKEVDMSLLTEPSDAERELEKDAMAIYQVADHLYTNQRYAIDGLREIESRVAPVSGPVQNSVARSEQEAERRQ